MKSYTANQFKADFQHKVGSQLGENLPLDHVLTVMDFSENISLVPQDEIESAHFTTKQVTLHPVHVVRHAADSTPEEPNIIKESLVIYQIHFPTDAVLCLPLQTIC